MNQRNGMDREEELDEIVAILNARYDLESSHHSHAHNEFKDQRDDDRRRGGGTDARGRRQTFAESAASIPILYKSQRKVIELSKPSALGTNPRRMSLTDSTSFANPPNHGTGVGSSRRHSICSSPRPHSTACNEQARNRQSTINGASATIAGTSSTIRSPTTCKGVYRNPIPRGKFIQSVVVTSKGAAKTQDHDSRVADSRYEKTSSCDRTTGLCSLEPSLARNNVHSSTDYCHTKCQGTRVNADDSFKTFKETPHSGKLPLLMNERIDVSCSRREVCLSEEMHTAQVQELERKCHERHGSLVGKGNNFSSGTSHSLKRVCSLETETQRLQRAKELARQLLSSEEKESTLRIQKDEKLAMQIQLEEQFGYDGDHCFFDKGSREEYQTYSQYQRTHEDASIAYELQKRIEFEEQQKRNDQSQRDLKIAQLYDCMLKQQIRQEEIAIINDDKEFATKVWEQEQQHSRDQDQNRESSDLQFARQLQDQLDSDNNNSSASRCTSQYWSGGVQLYRQRRREPSERHVLQSQMAASSTFQQSYIDNAVSHADPVQPMKDDHDLQCALKAEVIDESDSASQISASEGQLAEPHQLLISVDTSQAFCRSPQFAEKTNAAWMSNSHDVRNFTGESNQNRFVAIAKSDRHHRSNICDIESTEVAAVSFPSVSRREQGVARPSVARSPLTPQRRMSDVASSRVRPFRVDFSPNNFREVQSAQSRAFTPTTSVPHVCAISPIRTDMLPQTHQTREIHSYTSIFPNISAHSRNQTVRSLSTLQPSMGACLSSLERKVIDSSCGLLPKLSTFPMNHFNETIGTTTTTASSAVTASRRNDAHYQVSSSQLHRKSNQNTEWTTRDTITYDPNEDFRIYPGRKFVPNHFADETVRNIPGLDHYHQRSTISNVSPITHGTYRENGQRRRRSLAEGSRRVSPQIEPIRHISSNHNLNPSSTTLFNRNKSYQQIQYSPHEHGP